MNLIHNYYTVENLLMKKYLSKKFIVFNFQGKGKIFQASCTYSISKKEYILNIKEYLPSVKRVGVTLENYSLGRLDQLKDLTKNRMKKLGFKNIENPKQLELDINKNKGQLNLGDIEESDETKEANLKKAILKEYKGESVQRLSEIIDEFFGAPHFFYSDICDYIKDNKGYADQAHIDNDEIKSDKISLEGIFRDNEVTDWEAYEEDGFPDDVDNEELNAKELMTILSYPLD